MYHQQQAAETSQQLAGQGPYGASLQPFEAGGGGGSSQGRNSGTVFDTKMKSRTFVVCRGQEDSGGRAAAGEAMKEFKDSGFVTDNF